MSRSSQLLAVAVAVFGLAGCDAKPQPETPPASETSAPAAPAAATPASATTDATAASAPGTGKPRLVSPVKGLARVEITKPSTKIVRNEVVTTYLLKNLESKPIAGFRSEEHWYTAGGETIGSNIYRHRSPIQPGEVIQVEFRMQRNPKQSRNRFTFAHINGEIKQTVVPKLDPPPPPKPVS